MENNTNTHHLSHGVSAKLPVATRFIEHFILRRFLEIPLTPSEQNIAKNAIIQKYKIAISRSFMFSILLIPSLLLLDTAIVVSVLIPTTMVAGTAWFSVSLASMKQKFEDFGMELTTDLFVAFSLSLMMLFLATTASLTSFLWAHWFVDLEVSFPSVFPAIKLISALLALLVVGMLLYSIFAGSLKYDINDAMLTGQNEAAERFFRKSLSVLHETSQSLRTDRNIEIANYSIGVAFYEVYTNIGGADRSQMPVRVRSLRDKAQSLIENPSMDERDANVIAVELVSSFAELCDQTGKDCAAHKSLKAIKDEIECLKNNTESQEMVDMRMSVILTEVSILLEEFGHSIAMSANRTE